MGKGNAETIWPYPSRLAALGSLRGPPLCALIYWEQPDLALCVLAWEGTSELLTCLPASSTLTGLL